KEGSNPTSFGQCFFGPRAVTVVSISRTTRCAGAKATVKFAPSTSANGRGLTGCTSPCLCPTAHRAQQVIHLSLNALVHGVDLQFSSVPPPGLRGPPKRRAQRRGVQACSLPGGYRGWPPRSCTVAVRGCTGSCTEVVR